MVVKPEQAGQDSFKRVQSLRNSVDVALSAGACCASNLSLVRSLLSTTALVLPVGLRDSLRARENSLHGHVESCKILEDRIRNSIDLVSFCICLTLQLSEYLAPAPADAFLPFKGRLHPLATQPDGDGQARQRDSRYDGADEEPRPGDQRGDAEAAPADATHGRRQRRCERDHHRVRHLPSGELCRCECLFRHKSEAQTALY